MLVLIAVDTALGSTGLDVGAGISPGTDVVVLGFPQYVSPNAITAAWSAGEHAPRM